LFADELIIRYMTIDDFYAREMSDIAR